MARTNKTERTAMNLTRLAAANNVRVNSMLSQELYELAKDNNVAMFDGRDCKTCHIEHVVFIPQKIADENFSDWCFINKPSDYTNSDTFSYMLKKWYRKAMNYNANSGE